LFGGCPDAAQLIGASELDLTKDPPPDLVNESDLISSSLNRSSNYAGWGVLEIWQIENQEVVLWVLTDGAYHETVASRAFPFLSSERLNDLVCTGIHHRQPRASRAFHNSTFAVKPREIPFPPDAGHEKHDRLRLSNRSYSS
jgi:hypothetical protein